MGFSMPSINRTAEDMTENAEGESGNDTQQRAAGLKPTAATEDSQSPYSGHVLCQLSYLIYSLALTHY